MNTFHFKILALVFLLAATPARAYFLDYFKVQHAGEIGEVALGVGKRFGPVYSLEYLHGTVTEATGGTRITTLALKNNFDFYPFEYKDFYLDFYAGVMIFHVTGLRYQTRRVRQYPASYYSMGSLRGQLYLGAKGRWRRASPHQFYYEAGLNDVWLVKKLRNGSDAVNPFDYVALALGYNYLF